MLLNCSISYCQNNEIDDISTGCQDSINVAICDIRIANNLLIEGKYYKNIYSEQNEIIELKQSYILTQDSIIKDMQSRIIKSTDINNKLKKDYEKQKKHIIVGYTIAGCMTVGLAACLIGIFAK